MSARVFPMNLPGMRPRVERTEEFATQIHGGGWWSATEERVKGLSVPRFRYALAFAGLRTALNAPAPNAAYKEHALVLSFLRDHYGAWDTFLFDDPLDGFRRTVRLVADSMTLSKEGGWWAVQGLDLVTVGTALSVAVTPTTATPARLGTQQFTALVTDAAFDNTVTWSVQSGLGSVTQAGLYTAPNQATTAVVRATSDEATGTYAQATVTVT